MITVIDLVHNGLLIFSFLIIQNPYRISGGPDFFTNIIMNILRDIQQDFTIYFTGLSNSGKSIFHWKSNTFFDLFNEFPNQF